MISVYRLKKAISMDQTFMQIDTNSGVFTMTHKKTHSSAMRVKLNVWRVSVHPSAYECICACGIVPYTILPLDNVMNKCIKRVLK